LAKRHLLGNRPIRITMGNQKLKVNFKDFSLKTPAPPAAWRLKPAAANEVQPAAGLKVLELFRGGYGEWLGLKVNDIVVSCADKPVRTVEGLDRLLSANCVKLSVHLTVMRDGTRLEGEVAPLDLGATWEPVRDGWRLYDQGRFADAKHRAVVKDGYDKLKAGD
jgi:hypothetical protein